MIQSDNPDTYVLPDKYFSCFVSQLRLWMRKVVAHLIVTLDDVVALNSFIEMIARQRDKDEVLVKFLVEGDTMRLG